MSALRLHMKAGERLFLNGTVVAVDRRCALTILGEASFLREAYVMQVEDASTPLRRLYFTVQGMIIGGADASAALNAGVRIEQLLAAARSPDLVAGLLDAREALPEKPHHALRALRPLFSIEDARLEEAA